MLRQIVEERWFNPKAVIGFWPANAVGDDIRLFTGESRSETLATFHGLRQQLSKRDGRPNLCLADFVAPAETGLADYIGAFVVTAGIEEVRIAQKFERANDDYRSILVKALADRLAEALAERMHAARAPGILGLRAGREPLQRAARRRGVPRHPPGAGLSGAARPHREGDALPPAPRPSAASASSSPKASPCGRARRCRVSTSPIPTRTISASPRSSATRSRITPRRKGMSIAEVERWLSPILNYDPARYRLEAAE